MWDRSGLTCLGQESVCPVGLWDFGSEMGRGAITSTVPSDAPQVDQTWRYVNKKGGPDRRFNNNRQLPVLLYGEIQFTSATGLNEVIQVSNPKAPSNFVLGVRSITVALA